MSCGQVSLGNCLFEAINNIDLRSIIFLLENHGADPNRINQHFKIAPIHYICGFDNVCFAEKVTKVFLKYKANPNLLSEEEGLTPLHIACIWGKPSLVKLLLIYGADLDIECSEGKTPDKYAATENSCQVSEVIKAFVLEQRKSIEKKHIQSLKERNLKHVNYNNDKDDTFIANIFHHYETSQKNSIASLESDENDQGEKHVETCPQTNFLELTEKNLKKFNQKLSPVIIRDRLSIHKHQSYVRKWQQDTIKKLDRNINYTFYGSLLTKAKSESFDKPKLECTKSSSDTFTTAKYEMSSMDATKNDEISTEKKNVTKEISNLQDDELNKKDESKLTKSFTNEDFSNGSMLSKEFEIQPLVYDTGELRRELTRITGGAKPGPITNSSTRKIYLKKLTRLKKEQQNQTDQASFSMELQQSLESFETFESKVAYFLKLESQMVNHFLENSHIKWTQEANMKTSFIYFLIDPRISENLPNQNNLNKRDIWAKFLASIFYVGKGKKTRPYNHLYDALTLYSTENSTLAKKLKIINDKNLKKMKESFARDSKKLNKIVEIWKSKKGIVCLHIFHNIYPCEAFSREAAIIDAIGIENLTNLIKGQYYGVTKNFSAIQKRHLGIGLLYRACSVYLAEGESQVSPFDLV